VFVEDITDQPEFEREEEDVGLAESGPSSMGQKRKVWDVVHIKLPYLPDTMIIVDDMIGKLPKIRYVDHDVHYATKFLYLVEDTYLINTGEVGPLGKLIMEHA
jgi:hypothetical protein